MAFERWRSMILHISSNEGGYKRVFMYVSCPSDIVFFGAEHLRKQEVPVWCDDDLWYSLYRRQHETYLAPTSWAIASRRVIASRTSPLPKIADPDTSRFTPAATSFPAESKFTPPSTLNTSSG